MLRGIVNTQYYSSHSFRIGSATTIAVNGASDERIKQCGCWSSQAFRRYVRDEVPIPGVNPYENHAE